MTVAQELEDRLWYLADPKVKWVQRWPVGAEVCLVRGNGVRSGLAFSPTANDWLIEFVRLYAGMLPSYFNDRARRREEVLWLLEEAVEQARWEGV